jgi:hypothetical protein
MTLGFVGGLATTEIVTGQCIIALIIEMLILMEKCKSDAKVVAILPTYKLTRQCLSGLA